MLNGTSCSGKTRLVRALQALHPEPYLHAGLDHFEAMQPRKNGQRIHMFYGQGSRAHDLVHVLHVTGAAFAAARANQVVEHIFLERAWLKDVVARLAAYPVLFVGVRCPLEELERRERAETIEGAELFLYPGEAHLFTDVSLPDYDAGAATLLKQRVLGFLVRIDSPR